MLGSKKSGFTFVELAIVLVIIGIIMGMAIKGRTLIESAKMRSEVRKIEKVQAAIAGWFGNAGGEANAFKKAASGDADCTASTLTVTGADNLTCLDITVLKDLKSNDKKSPGDNWTLWRGAYATDNASKPTEFGQGSNFLLVLGKTSPRFFCNVESMMDDKGYRTADGRSNIAEKKDLSTGTYLACDDMEWTDSVTNGQWLSYLLM
jgi:prepilin-type N-terminal cleavage/methylation domain-containing protein